MEYAIILAGGRGERFWPLSRKAHPKQFLSLINEKSFLRNTFERLNKKFNIGQIYVITHTSYISKVKKILPELNYRNIIGEPIGKNTAAPIGLITHLLSLKDKEATIAVFPSDHLILNSNAFLNTVFAGIKFAKKSNSLVAVGVKPRYAAVGYGYLKINPQSLPESKKSKIYKVERFTEKPNKATASRFLNSKHYLWNGGIFIFKCSVMLEAIKKYLPSFYRELVKINAKNVVSGNKLSRLYSRIKSVSIDYGIMEKAKNIYTITGEFFWDDIGSWRSIAKLRSKDKNGNVVIGNCIGVDTKDSIIVCEGNHLVGTLGVNDIIIVQTSDATLVCHKDKAEDLKKLINKIDKDYL